MNTPSDTPLEETNRRIAFTSAEVAARLGTCTKTVYRLCQRGLLKRVRGIRTVLITQESLDRFLRS